MLSPSDPGRPHHDSSRGSSLSRNMRNIDGNGGNRPTGNGQTNHSSNNRKFSFLRYILQITILIKGPKFIMCFINKHQLFSGGIHRGLYLQFYDHLEEIAIMMIRTLMNCLHPLLLF